MVLANPGHNRGILPAMIILVLSFWGPFRDEIGRVGFRVFNRPFQLSSDSDFGKHEAYGSREH